MFGVNSLSFGVCDFVLVEDFDECKAGQDNCDQHETCVNKEGSFECKGNYTVVNLSYLVCCPCISSRSYSW